MVQYSQPLSKASQFELSFAMHENFKMGVTVCFVHFSLCWFLPVEVRLYDVDSGKNDDLKWSIAELFR
jgi:hypothetical protein